MKKIVPLSKIVLVVIIVSVFIAPTCPPSPIPCPDVEFVHDPGNYNCTWYMKVNNPTTTTFHNIAIKITFKTLTQTGIVLSSITNIPYTQNYIASTNENIIIWTTNPNDYGLDPGITDFADIYINPAQFISGITSEISWDNGLTWASICGTSHEIDLSLCTCPPLQFISAASCCWDIIYHVTASYGNPQNAFKIEFMTPNQPTVTWNTSLLMPYWTLIQDSYNATNNIYTAVWDMTSTAYGDYNFGRICLQNSGGVNFPVSVDFSYDHGITWWCSQTINLVDPCCGWAISASPNIVCETGTTVLTSSGYPSSNGTCIHWYSSTSDPGSSLPPNPPWNPNIIGTGTNYNTTALACNPAGMMTTYWYQAVVEDPGCDCSPMHSNTVTVEVIPVYPMYIDGPNRICTGSGSLLGLYDQSTLNLLNTSCIIEWWDVTDPSPSNHIMLSSGAGVNQFQTPVLYSNVCPCKRYTYEARVCPACNRKRYDVYVYASTYPTNITALRNHICWGEGTTLNLVDDNYCDKIQWEISNDLGVTWNPIVGGANTTIWNTGRLIDNTIYRVRFDNGPCQPTYSNELTIYIHEVYTVSISPSHCQPCPNIFCPNVIFDLQILPSPTPGASWEWYKDGIPIPGTSGLWNYTTNIPGDYYVYLTDPVCGNVTSNILSPEFLTAILSGPVCICFTPGPAFVDLIVASSCIFGSPTVDWNLEKNGLIINMGSQALTSSGELILTNIEVEPDDRFRVYIFNANCGDAWTNYYYPTGCERQ